MSSRLCVIIYTPKNDLYIVILPCILVYMKKIPLSRGKFSLIDDEDYELVSKFNWNAQKHPYTFYAYTTVGDSTKRISMHRLIMGLKKGDGLVVDHKDNDGLNNQRSNLQVVSASDNSRFMYERNTRCV